MIGAQHRQLLEACKALLNRLELRGSIDPAHWRTQEDWRVIVMAYRAISESRAVLEIAGNSRKAVNRI